VLDSKARVPGLAGGGAGEAKGDGGDSTEGEGGAAKRSKGRQKTTAKESTTEAKGAAAALIDFSRWAAQRGTWAHLHGCAQGQTFGNASFQSHAGELFTSV